MHTQSTQTQWRTLLANQHEIAAYIAEYSSDEVDFSLVVDFYHGAEATLQRVQIADLTERAADANVPCATKQAMYESLPEATMPPIVVEGGVVQDGNHRLRACIARGLLNVLAYVVRDAS